MNQILLILIAGLLVPVGLHAQKVYTKDDKVILDMTVAAGMPAGAVTSTPKDFVKFTPYIDKFLNENDNNSISTNNNETVYSKLEIAPHNLNSNGTFGGDVTLNWVNAFIYCKNADYNGTGWRLPTQRELQMMYLFKPALKSIFPTLGGTAIMEVGYWSSTEDTSKESWVVTFVSGGTYSLAKNGSNRARCVREITD